MPERKNYHDAFFKEVMSNPKTARDFLQNYLPTAVVSALDLPTLAPVKDSFVDAELQEHFSDLLFRIKLKQGDEAYIFFLFEHKSSPDKWAAWQVLRYEVRHWEQETRNDESKKLSLIIPIVFYHGQARWNFDTRFSALIDFGGREDLREYAPEFRIYLYDLSRYADEEIKGAAILRILLLVMKYVFSKHLDEKLKDIYKMFREVRGSRGTDYLVTVSTYLLKAVQYIDRQELHEAIAVARPGKEDVIMGTLTQEWLQEGKEQGILLGIQQGRQEEALRMTLRQLERKIGALDTKTQKRVQALATEQLEELGLALFDFKTKADLITWLRNHSGK